MSEESFNQIIIKKKNLCAKSIFCVSLIIYSILNIITAY